MKPKLFLCAGMPKAGTTTLWKILEDKNLINDMNYKETHYLKILCDLRIGDIVIKSKSFLFDITISFRV